MVDWKKPAIRCIRRKTQPFLMEEIRHQLAKRNIFAPVPQAWGGLTTDLLKAELIVRTGKSRVSKDKRNHSRTLVFRVKGK
jgi:hypothetical protein